MNMNWIYLKLNTLLVVIVDIRWIQVDGFYVSSLLMNDVIGIHNKCDE